MNSNIPTVRLGVVAVSRDCFVISLSEKRRAALVQACKGLGQELYEAKTTVENEVDMLKAVAEVKEAGCNALVVFLGNFGPETPETLLAKNFTGPVMYLAAAEEDDLMGGRGDAYCGLLNCSYNLGLRSIPAVIPEKPVGTAEELAQRVGEFVPVARALLGLASLKVITFGPRPQDFFACNAPIKALYDLGVEVQENSELDLLVSYKAHAGDHRIPSVCQEMEAELGEGNFYPDLMARMAQFELTLLDWREVHKGASQHVVFANKCWPAFPTQFGFEPCYVNSRLAARGIPVGCEVDIYGAVSEFIGACVTGGAVTLLDINNTVPAPLYKAAVQGKFAYAPEELFMGFHCGNTPLCMLKEGAVKYQLIQNRLLENGGQPDVTRGTLEGDIAAGNITFFRLHSNADTTMQAYITQGEVLPVETGSFGGIGVFAIPGMGRFYRHVLVGKRYPHHGAVVHSHIGGALFTIFSYLGIEDIEYNRPSGHLYKGESPFA